MFLEKVQISKQILACSVKKHISAKRDGPGYNKNCCNYLISQAIFHSSDNFVIMLPTCGE